MQRPLTSYISHARGSCRLIILYFKSRVVILNFRRRSGLTFRYASFINPPNPGTPYIFGVGSKPFRTATPYNEKINLLPDTNDTVVQLY